MAKTTHSAGVNLAASTTDGAFSIGTLPSALAGYRVGVYGVAINHGDTTPSTVIFNSKGSSSGTAISATLKAPANGGFVMGPGPEPWFTTNRSEGLTVTTGSGSTTGIQVIWKYIP